MTGQGISKVAAKGPWAEPWAYSRALRFGDVVEVSGTTAVDPNGIVVAPGDVYGQTKQALQTVGAALAELGASLGDVVRTRVFIRDIGQWEQAGRAHHEIFRDVKPVSTCIGGADFLLPEILVEVEATALLAGNGSKQG
jgi:enamine deaminase RidA (YjgF/YER057c/UK114 family)